MGNALCPYTMRDCQYATTNDKDRARQRMIEYGHERKYMSRDSMGKMFDYIASLLASNRLTWPTFCERIIGGEPFDDIVKIQPPEVKKK